jgi:hypothetical protein
VNQCSSAQLTDIRTVGNAVEVSPTDARRHIRQASRDLDLHMIGSDRSSTNSNLHVISSNRPDSSSLRMSPLST